MAAPDARDPRRDDERPGSSTDHDDADTPVERAVTSVMYGIDQVADKVKGLLRSDR